MKRCPKIGQRVRYVPSEKHTTVGECVGVVTKIYKTHAYAWADDDPRWDGDENPPVTGFRDESEWHVAMRPEQKPSPWCYGEQNEFAPQVKNLRRP